MDINNDGTVDWDELSSFMIEMGMKGWANSGVGMPNYAYAGSIDSARPTHAADQVCFEGRVGVVPSRFEKWEERERNHVLSLLC